MIKRFDPYQWLKEHLTRKPAPAIKLDREALSQVIPKAFSGAHLLGVVRPGEKGSFAWLAEHPPNYEPPPCPVCDNSCSWCRTPSILRCGACYPRGPRPLRSAHTAARLPSEDRYEVQSKRLAALQAQCAHHNRTPGLAGGFVCQGCGIYLFH
jgi:hypothetical protein